MPMRKSLLSLTLLAIVAGSAASALAQSLPTTQPKFLHIYREEVKIGRSADHSRWEAGWPAAFEKAKFPDNYIALEAVSMAKQNADAALTAETERLSRGDAEFVSSVNAIEAVARPDLSHGTFPDLAMMRFWEISTFRVKPGHGEDFAAAAKAWASASARSAPAASWRTYQVVGGAPDGTYLIFSSYASFADFDKATAESEATWKGLTFDERTALQKFETDGALSTMTNRFRLDPRQSYVPAATRQKDPAFWMPPAAPTKAPAKKR
jgi:hypothetical protein